MKRRRGLRLITQTHDIIHSTGFLDLARKLPKYFTRKRKMDFVDVMTMLLNFLSKSLRMELDEYFDRTDLLGRITKQAFSKARQKIRFEAFQFLYQQGVELIMSETDQFHLWKGFRLYAIDGTEIYVEPTKENIEFFGQKKKRDNCKAKVSVLMEVFDRFTVHAGIGRYDKGERVFASEHIEYLEQFRTKKDLIIRLSGTNGT